MNWLALLKIFLGLAKWASQYVSEQQLREDGAARATLQLLKDLQSHVEKAAAARNDVPPPGRLRDDDGHRRD